MHWRSVTAAMICLAAPACAANLIKDGGFENPKTPAGGYTLYDSANPLGAWTVVGAQGNVATVSGSYMQDGLTFAAKAGKAYADLTGMSNTATGVAQTLPTVQGSVYRLTFWVGNVVDGGGPFGTRSTVNVYAGSELIKVATNKQGAGSSTQVWKKFTVEFQAPGPITLAFINGDPSNDSDCGLDAVSLVQE